MKRLIIFAIIVLAGAGGAAYYFMSATGGIRVDMDFSVMPSQILVGQPFDLGISVSNYSDQVMGNAKLTLLLPEGVVFKGQDASQRASEQLVGDLGPGGILRQESFELIVLKDPQSVKRLSARVSYSLGGKEGTRYESQKDFDLNVGQSAMTLNFSVPEQVFSGQDFELAVRYQNNTEQDLRNVRLRLDYPPVFKFQDATADPSQGNNIWELGTVLRNGTGSFTVAGTITGPSQSSYAFKGSVSANYSGQDYPLTEQASNVSVAASPLAVAVILNNDPNYVARLDDYLTYTLAYQNNSGVPMANVTVRAQLKGEMLNFSALQTDGVFDSRTNTVTWNASNKRELASLGPGESGALQVNIRTRTAYTPRRLGDKNYILKLTAEIESPSVPPGTAAAKTISIAQIENRMAGQAAFDMTGYFRDAGSGILNSGPYPPQVNKTTRYTIHWRIRNYATDLTNAQVSAYLQSGARCTGAVKSTIAAQPVCNPDSGQVTWQVGNLAANQGVLDAPVEAIFQVEATPAVNQVNQPLTLIGDAQFTAMDNFTGLALASTDRAITTDLPDDATLLGDRRIRQ